MSSVTRRLLAALVYSILTVPFQADGQQAQKVPKIGFLWIGSPGAPSPLIEAFENGLRNLGWVQGENMTIEYRYAEGKAERFPDLAAELVHLPVEVIVAPPAPATLASKTATTTIPIVFTLGADPFAFGVLTAPQPLGGNITGLTEITPELTPKRLELLREIMPALSRVAILLQPGTLRDETFGQMAKDAEETARSLGLKLQFVEARPGDDLDLVFDQIANERAEALVVLMSPTFNSQTKRLADLASKHRLPTIYEWRFFPTAGGLISYGAEPGDIYRRAATLVDKILKGAKPADLPIEQPTKLELVVNMKVARELNLTIPPSLVQQANELIR
jgi:putative ABC transport system substrate-binding protein